MTEGLAVDVLRRLGRGDRIDDVARDAGMTRDALLDGWRAETKRRLPDYDGERPAGARAAGGLEILRDDRAVPHVFAATDEDLFFGYGYAQAQDRLFQMDLRRRRAHGRLAEVLGKEGIEPDVLARTVDLPGLARAELARLAPETRALLDAFAAGVNALIEQTADRPPIEFDLLGYRPEPWTALDSVACAASWRWQLTGRPWVISIPEFVERTVGTELADAFVRYAREPDDVPILEPGSYATHRVGAWPTVREAAWAGGRAAARASAGRPTAAATTGPPRGRGRRAAARWSRAIRTCPTSRPRRSSRSTCRAARSTSRAPG